MNVAEVDLQKGNVESLQDWDAWDQRRRTSLENLKVIEDSPEKKLADHILRYSSPIQDPDLMTEIGATGFEHKKAHKTAEEPRTELSGESTSWNFILSEW